MQRKHIFSEGEWYHLCNRGANKGLTFLDESDYRRFMELLYLCNSTTKTDLHTLLREGLTFPDILQVSKTAGIVDIIAFCLMPNHFHVLLSPKADTDVSDFMQRLTTGYTMYFNKRHSRSGSLFQGTFKSRHVENDAHLQYLFSYIHLNPIKTKDPLWTGAPKESLSTGMIKAFSYPYSSIGAYVCNNHLFNRILERERAPWRWESASEFRTELLSWSDGAAKEQVSEMEEI